MSNTWGRNEVLEECDRLAYHAEAMRDFADRRLLEERQQRKVRQTAVDVFIVATVLLIVAVVYRFG